MILAPDCFFDSTCSSYYAYYEDDILYVERRDKATGVRNIYYLTASRMLKPVPTRQNKTFISPIDIKAAERRLNHLLLFDPYTPFFSKHQFFFYAYLDEGGYLSVKVIAYQNMLTADFLVHPDNFWETRYWALKDGCDNDRLLKKDILVAKEALRKACKLAGVEFRR